MITQSYKENIYDETGIAGMIYNSSYYYYEKNVLGDVVAVLDINNNEVASYTYDAWGNVISQSGSMADKNPIRYRGYYYDTETGFYYLQSRYYDPSIRRFINADNHSIIGALSQSAGEINLYAYCGNNPVMYIDPSGNSFIGVLLQVVVSVGAYLSFALASLWDEEISNDMSSIDWNFFNTNKEAVYNSSKVSFYKGVPVRRTNLDRPGSFLFILLNQNQDPNIIDHEYGHNIQQMLVGPVTYGLTIALPSYKEWSKKEYHQRPWEITANVFGGYQSNYSQGDIDRGFQYLLASKYFGPLAFLFLIGEYR